MIVDENDCCRSLRDRFTKDFAGMNERRVQQAPRYSDVALQPVLRVQNRDVELLDRKILESLREDLVHVARPPHRSTLLPLLGRHSSAELPGCMDTNSTSRSYASDARQCGNGLCCEQS